MSRSLASRVVGRLKREWVAIRETPTPDPDTKPLPDTSRIDNEHFVPVKGLELDEYLEAEDICGIHHIGRYMWAIEVLKQRRPQRILDIACGAGYGSFMLAMSLPDTTVVGIDYDPAAIAEAMEFYVNSNLHFHVGDVTRWHYGQFDAIVSFDTIEHVMHREIMMQNFADHLDPAGVLLLSTPVPGEIMLNPAWHHHKIEYSASALYDFTRRYFQSVLHPGNGLPCCELFETTINKDTPRYHLSMNPLVCERPIRIE